MLCYDVLCCAVDRVQCSERVVRCMIELEEFNMHFVGVSRAIANNKLSPSLSNGRKKHLKPNALPLMLPSKAGDLSSNLFLSFSLWNHPICFKRCFSMLELSFLYIYPSIFPLQASKMKEIVKSIMLMSSVKSR